MIDVIDRVPTIPNRMKITHSDGSEEYVTLERADEPTQGGTPINRALFKSIEKDLSRLTMGGKSIKPTTATPVYADKGNILTPTWTETQGSSSSYASFHDYILRKNNMSIYAYGFYNKTPINMVDNNSNTYCNIHGIRNTQYNQITGYGTDNRATYLACCIDLGEATPIGSMVLKLEPEKASRLIIVGHDTWNSSSWTYDVSNCKVLSSINISSSTSTYNISLSNNGTVKSFRYYSIFFYNNYDSYYELNVYDLVANVGAWTESLAFDVDMYNGYSDGDIVRFNVTNVDSRTQGRFKININSLGDKDTYPVVDIPSGTDIGYYTAIYNSDKDRFYIRKDI